MTSGRLEGCRIITAMLDIIGADFLRDAGDFTAMFKLGKLAFKASNVICY